MMRWCSLLLALMLCCSVAAAEPIADDALMIVAEMLAAEVDLAASSPVYMELFSVSDNIQARLDTWSAGDHLDPTAVYRVQIDGDIFAAMADMSGLSPTLSANLQSRCTVAVVSGLNAAHGTEALAASSCAQVTTAIGGTTGCCIYFLCYAEGADVAVCFYPIDGGISGATAIYLADKYTEESLKECLGEMMTVEKLR